MGINTDFWGVPMEDEFAAAPQPDGPKVISFNERDVVYLINAGLAEDYVEAELTFAQFEVFERWCSGSHLAGGYEAARNWAERHLAFLDKEASEYEAEGYGYDLPLGYCAFAAIPCFVMYETTRGTLLIVEEGDRYYVRIPTSRCGGYHHNILQNLLDGWTEEQIDRRINGHRDITWDRSERPVYDDHDDFDDRDDFDDFDDFDGAEEDYDY